MDPDIRSFGPCYMVRFKRLNFYVRFMIFINGPPKKNAALFILRSDGYTFKQFYLIKSQKKTYDALLITLAYGWLSPLMYYAFFPCKLLLFYLFSRITLIN